MPAVISGRQAQLAGAAKPIPPYQSPPIEVGALVLFYPNCDKRHPVSGEVAVSNKNVNGDQIREIDVRLVDGQEMTSVMHIGDPRTTDPRVRSNGCWDYKPEPDYVAELRQQVVDVKAELAGLQEEFGDFLRSFRTLEDFVTGDGSKKQRADKKAKLVAESNSEPEGESA